jgi:hypothetical protein
VDEDLTTEELRAEQARREKDARDAAETAPTGEGAEAERRRAEKAAYLREKLEQRKQAEREAD